MSHVAPELKDTVSPVLSARSPSCSSTLRLSCHIPDVPQGDGGGGPPGHTNKSTTNSQWHWLQPLSVCTEEKVLAHILQEDGVCAHLSHMISKKPACAFKKNQMLLCFKQSDVKR